MIDIDTQMLDFENLAWRINDWNIFVLRDRNFVYMDARII